MKPSSRLAVVLALSLLSPVVASASDYPPDYPICSVDDTVVTGPFEVIRHTSRLPSKLSTLTLSYRGYLRGLYPDSQIQFWVQLNGRTELLSASAGTHDDAYVFLNAGPRGCTKCMRYLNTPLCNAHFAAGGQEGVWVCEQPNAVESNLFLYAFDTNLNLNAWDIYVAATAGGQWDSNLGANYFARLPARSSCW
ncbi:hypothetical protein LZ198_36540 [Myxococcus sp. K15C18031901]|uniref:hypothetical protein n=1 Tax=Myxococcus dinghuensis TaxID=2906761 RepID=UPI0020A7E45A|nr:hypothetical protein [Myxococcus dinghuensis]MCP3104387.1 hypothetical protein [Myxococcus dinghuensis]